jgi:hypothetical protein
MTQHMAGTVRLKNADTGAAIAYDPADPSSAEPFCLSCHDADGAAATFRNGGTPTAPFIDGSVMGQAPNRASVEILTHWNKTFGHRRQGLTCLGNGAPNTGCHANGHSSTHVGLLARNLALPFTKQSYPFIPADEPEYDLCFSCHAGFPRVTKEAILGMKQGGAYAIEALISNPDVAPPYFIPAIQTRFRDHNGVSANIYDDPVFFGQFLNLHLFHLQIPISWNYRDSIRSSIHCLSCHSIHGSNTPFGWVHDEMLFSHFTGVGTDTYSMMDDVVLDQLDVYPTSCVFNCHSIMGTTHGWFEPSGE